MRIGLCLVCALMGTSLNAREVNSAEDPFALEQGERLKKMADRPWANRSPKELQQWARENLHPKLTARKVIDANKHPEWDWFRKSGLGIFLHWGLPSANPNTGDAWAIQWNEAKARSGRYMEPASRMFAVAETWNPDNYDPGKWMAAASKAGFGYAVLTARHHDGYALWPSEHGTWNTGTYMDGRDLIVDYVEACRKNGMRVGFYYSGPSWHFAHEQKSFGGPKSGEYFYNYMMEKVTGRPAVTAAMMVAEKKEAQGQVRELMQNYGPIDVMWWDGSVAMTDEELQTMQPTVFVARGNIATPEGTHQAASHNVKVTNEARWWWETCQKSENSWTPNWHYGVECETNHWDTPKLLSELVRCRSLGGNLLVNVPPRGNGEMMEWFYEVCDEMAAWMKHSREAVYDVDLDAPLPTLDKTQNYTTVRGKTWYAMPNDNNTVFIHEIERPESISLLRTGAALDYEYQEGSLRVVLPTVMQTDLPDMVKIVYGD